MQIEIDDNLVERVKNVLGGCISQEAVEGTIAMLIRDSVEKDEKKQGLAPKMFRIKTWIPVEIDPKEDVDVQYSTREAAEKE
ncbi:MAG: hypothetical protein KAW47_08300, partial [Thermoplasmatales archaeon]|nr:hypothetical protein [Thermoplasmatales archaeon]